jgi:hypothetical protein
MNKAKRMGDIVASYHNSGMGPKEFTSINGLTLSELNYWVKKLSNQKLSNQKSPSSFIQINPGLTNPADDLVELHYPNGVKIKLAKTDLSLLNELVRLY